MIKRQIERKVKSVVGKFPVISITGPRQSGKTTFVKNSFPDYEYVNFEDIEQREFALYDPKGFLKSKGKHLIIDEAQYVPAIFSYIQLFVDDDSQRQYILTGSQNFLLMEKISQSLAGRVAVFYLLPFSVGELKNASFLQSEYSGHILSGGYPPIFDKKLNSSEWLTNYLTTYVERDVRQLLNVSDINSFQKFVALCAGRIGQLINFSSIANDLSLSYHTVQRWLSILETSFIAFRLYPYYKNYNKRLVKTPKLYFYDTGLASTILGIRNSEQLQTHFLKGGLFENFIISELFKNRFNWGLKPDYYFWRNNKGVEIDCIKDDADNITAIEIKSGTTIHQEFFKNLLFYQNISGISDKQSVLVYGGNVSYHRTPAKILSWRDIDTLY